MEASQHRCRMPERGGLCGSVKCEESKVDADESANACTEWSCEDRRGLSLAPFEPLGLNRNRE